MASREATLRLNLNSSAFESRMRGLASGVAAAGTRLGSAMSAPLSAGLNAAKSSLSGMANQIKNTAKNMIMFGGAISLGGLVKNAVEMQSLYRRIAFDVSKIKGETYDWQEVQQLIASHMRNTGQSSSNMAKAFHLIFQATGDLEYSADALQAIGIAATASGQDVDVMANAAQLMLRKFDIAAKDMPDALAALLQLTGVGGKGLDELGPRFGILAGEAKTAGMKGAEGMKELLGMFKLLDNEIGEKAEPGVMSLFRQLRAGSGDVKAFSKVGVKFAIDATPLQRFRKILNDTAGRKLAISAFGGGSKEVYDVLVRPFDEAFKRAKSEHKTDLEATNLGITAFDEALTASTKTSWDFDTLQKKAKSRIAEDPSIQMNLAIGKMKSAFNKPEVVAAMNKVATVLPKLATALADFLAWIVKNPWKGVAAFAGGKALLAGGGAAIGVAAPAIGVALVNSVRGMLTGAGAAGVGAAAGTAGATTAGAAATAAAASTGTVFPTVAGGAASAASGAAGIGAGALVAGTAIAAAGGAAVGYSIYKGAVEPALAARLEGLRGIDELLMTAEETSGGKATRSGNLKAVLEKVRAAQEEGAPTGFSSFMSSIAKTAGADIDSAEKQHADRLLRLGEAEQRLLERLIALEKGAGGAAEKLRDVGKAGPVTAPGTHRGVKASAHNAPGAAPVPQGQ